jgi:hypothetical protein
MYGHELVGKRIGCTLECIARFAHRHRAADRRRGPARLDRVSDLMRDQAPAAAKAEPGLANRIPRRRRIPRCAPIST